MADSMQGNNKAIAAGTSGALVVILAWAIDTFAHVQISIEVAAAFQTLFTTLAVYIVPHGGNT